MSTNYKGIILAGGSGTRLYPITKGVSKHLIPVYDKPMIYYPLSVLMLSGIKEVLIISTPVDIDSYRRLLNDGSDFGISIKYAIQPSPDGLAQAFIIGEKFIGDSNAVLALGDNIFYGQHFLNNLERAASNKIGATIFGCHVKDPERFGVIGFDKKGKVISVEEKPSNPQSNYAVTGLYFFDNDVVDIAKSVKPSNRGELEITSIINEYLIRDSLRVELMKDNFQWLDTGTNQSLLEASNFVQQTEESLGYKIGCIEEIAYKNQWIRSEDMINIIKKYKQNDYATYLQNILEEGF
jgi:glucose-1-phosphate thymidylyltransferase